MKIEERDNLLIRLNDLKILVVNSQRAISKQGDLVCNCLFSEEKARENIERYEGYIKDYSQEISAIEKRLEKR